MKNILFKFSMLAFLISSNLRAAATSTEASESIAPPRKCCFRLTWRNVNHALGRRSPQVTPTLADKIAPHVLTQESTRFGDTEDESSPNKQYALSIDSQDDEKAKDIEDVTTKQKIEAKHLFAIIIDDAGVKRSLVKSFLIKALIPKDNVHLLDNGTKLNTYLEIHPELCNNPLVITICDFHMPKFDGFGSFNGDEVLREVIPKGLAGLRLGWSAEDGFDKTHLEENIIDSILPTPLTFDPVKTAITTYLEKLNSPT